MIWSDLGGDWCVVEDNTVRAHLLNPSHFQHPNIEGWCLRSTQPGTTYHTQSYILFWQGEFEIWLSSSPDPEKSLLKEVDGEDWGVTLAKFSSNDRSWPSINPLEWTVGPSLSSYWTTPPQLVGKCNRQANVQEKLGQCSFYYLQSYWGGGSQEIVKRRLLSPHAWETQAYWVVQENSG